MTNKDDKHKPDKHKHVHGMQNFDKNPMLSNHQTIGHQPDKFVLDFKNTHPQFSPDAQAAMVVNHRTILLDPHVAKNFLETLKNNIEKFEEQYGKIEIPENIEKAKKTREEQQEEAVNSTERPGYMG